MDSSKIIIAADHAGYELKKFIISVMDKHEFIDLGTNSTDSVDYPDFAKLANAEIVRGTADFAILICGSGIGISIAANREPKIRCALCTTPEMAMLARQHNNANVLALGARFTKEVEAINIISAFINTEFEGGRHAKRVEKLSSS